MKEFHNTPYTMSDTLNKRGNEYFGRYRGTVLDNEDPDERGRCKVFVYGVYDESFNKDSGKRLPWAEPCQPLFCGGMGINGSFSCPEVGSTVWVFFDSGDITRPVMFGQTTDKDGKFDIFKPRIHTDKIDIELDKMTNTVTISADNVIVCCNRSEVASKDASLNANTVSLNTDVASVIATEVTIDSPQIKVTTEEMEVDGGFRTTTGATGIINGTSVASVKDGIIIGIT